MSRIVLVTGANRGIGCEVVRQLSAAGHATILGSRDLKSGEAAAASMSSSAAPIRTLELDVASPSSIQAVCLAVTREFGRLDGLVNNAGIFCGHSFDVINPNEIARMFEVNLTGPLMMISQFLPLLARSPVASIVNVSSATASLGVTSSGAGIAGDASRRLGYCCTKAALNMATVQYALAFAGSEAHKHIRINSVSPGYVATDMNGFRGERSVEDAAKLIVELAIPGPDGPTGKFVSDLGPVPW
jgi:NAD(P)-dependent dehydrogenase (short-subunit alcohol dehydrogenase family)